MSLNITVLSRKVIHQSGDFRLVDWHGRRVNFEAQKQVQITRWRWSAVVAFVGVGSTRRVNVADWLGERTAGLAQDSGFDALIDVLLTADEWIRDLPLQRRFHTFSVGAFVGHRPLFVLVSNFEAVHERPSRVARPRLRATYLRPRREQVFVTGRPATVTKLERQSLIGLLRARATPEVVMNRLAQLNAMAHTRDSDYISEHCFTSFVRLTGEGGGMVHGLDGRPFAPRFMIPELAGDAIANLIRSQFPEGAQLRSFSSMRSPGSESDHLVQIREKPNDPNAFNNYGHYLREVAKDDLRAEQQFLRALELDPHHSHALGNLANLMWDRGDLDRAEDLYRQSIRENPDNVTHRVNLGKFLLNARGDGEAALRLCEEGNAETTDKVPLLRLFADLLGRRGEYSRAVTQYERLHDMQPNDAEITLIYGSVLHATGAAPTDVEPLYRQVLAAEPMNGKALLNLSQIRFQVGAVDESAGLIRRALAVPLTDSDKVEALFCWYAIEGERGTLRELRSLLGLGARSKGWDLTPVVSQAVAGGHEEAELMRALAAVVGGERDVRDLDAFRVWRET
jgi:tetratricopeptide (TPR) repeat protein